MENTIRLKEAIKQMKALSMEDKTFSITFVSHDSNRKESKGYVRINTAKTRRKIKEKHLSRYKLYLMDFDGDQPQAKECWECLILKFNDLKVIL